MEMGAGIPLRAITSNTVDTLNVSFALQPGPGDVPGVRARPQPVDPRARSQRVQRRRRGLQAPGRVDQEDDGLKGGRHVREQFWPSRRPGFGRRRGGRSLEVFGKGWSVCKKCQAERMKQWREADKTYIFVIFYVCITFKDIIKV